MNKCEINSYFKAVKKAMHCPKKARKYILNNMISDVEEYINLHPSATMQEIQEHFGTPDSYAKEYIACLDSNILYHKVAKHQFRNTVWIAVGVAVVLIFSILAYTISKQIQDGLSYYYSEDISDQGTEIIE